MAHEKEARIAPVAERGTKTDASQPQARAYRDENDVARVSLSDLGIRLRGLRRSRGLSLRDLKDLSGVSSATMSKVENGHPTTTTTLLDVLDALDADLAIVDRRGAR